MEEIWKDIPGYEGLYQASNFGRIKSLERLIKQVNRIIHVKERILKNSIDRNGYLSVELYKDHVGKRIGVHRLVLLSFVPCNDRSHRKEVNHLNGIKTDNMVDNLEWCTQSENIKHAFRILRRNKGRGFLGRFGKLHHRSKPVIQFSLDGTQIQEYESIRLAEKSTEADSKGIINTAKGIQKQAGGFLWKYSQDVGLRV
jgi:hypothetical protein